MTYKVDCGTVLVPILVMGHSIFFIPNCPPPLLLYLPFWVARGGGATSGTRPVLLEGSFKGSNKILSPQMHTERVLTTKIKLGCQDPLSIRG